VTPTRFAQRSQDLTLGHIDEIFDPVHGSRWSNETIDLALDSLVMVRGWAVDVAARSPASVVYIILDGETEYPALYGLPRAEVAAALNSSDYRPCGFTAYIPGRSFSPGKHRLTVLVRSRDGRSYCVAHDREIITKIERDPAISHSGVTVHASLDRLRTARCGGEVGPWRFRHGDEVFVDGSVAVEAQARRVDAVRVQLNGERYLLARTGAPSHEVTFQALIPTSELAQGPHVLTVLARLDNQAALERSEAFAEFFVE
jgi:hypothetical protein